MLVVDIASVWRAGPREEAETSAVVSCWDPPCQVKARRWSTLPRIGRAALRVLGIGDDEAWVSRRHSLRFASPSSNRFSFACSIDLLTALVIACAGIADAAGGRTAAE